jgi:hypothetical protein
LSALEPEEVVTEKSEGAIELTRSRLFASSEFSGC